jgi:hypothetical protein
MLSREGRGGVNFFVKFLNKVEEEEEEREGSDILGS